MAAYKGSLSPQGAPEEDANDLDTWAAATWPGTGPTLWTGGAGYSVAALNPEEMAIFYRDFARLTTMYTMMQEVSEMLQNDVDRFLLAAQVAKASIGTNPSFAGVSASGNEVGFQLIRAASVLSGPNGAEVLNWTQNYLATGWTNVFGSAASPVDLSFTGYATYPATNLQNRTLLAFGALLDPVQSPRIGEYRFHVGPKDYGVNPLSWEPSSNLFFTRLGGFVVIPVNGRFYMRGNIQPAAGIDCSQLVGFTFCTGDYLTFET
jgi:hypothetical protein